MEINFLKATEAMIYYFLNSWLSFYYDLHKHTKSSPANGSIFCAQNTFVGKKIWLCYILLFFILFYPSNVKAQEDQPAWMRNLTCNPAEQKYQGINYCTTIIQGENGKEYLVHVIGIDLKVPGTQIEYLIPDGIDANGNLGECRDVNRSTKYLEPPRGLGCDDPENRDWYPVMSLEQAVKRAGNSNLAFVINGDYSACTISLESCGMDEYGQPRYRQHGPEGLTVVRGNRLDGVLKGDRDDNTIYRPWLVLSQTTPIIAEFHQSRSDDGSLPYDWVYTGIGGGPWLIQNGEVSQGAIESCQGVSMGSCRPDASQTAVGVSRDERWLFFTLGVRLEYLIDLAEFMKQELNVWQAIKFDGGGSSQLYYAGANEPYIERGDGRSLTNFLAVRALHTETPIKTPFDGTSEPPDTSPPLPIELISIRVDGFGMGSSTHLRAGINQYEQHVIEQQEMGIRWIREEFPWSEIEPSPGVFQWNYGNRDFDRMMALAKAHNLNVLALLAYGPGYNTAPTDSELLTAWERYVQAVVDRYGDQIDYWEIGNEMNSRFFWGKVVKPGTDVSVEPNPALYARMLASAYDIIKSHDRQDMVILGGLIVVTDGTCQTNPFVYLQGIYREGAWDKFDAIGFHPYWGSQPPEQPIDRGMEHDSKTGACLNGIRNDDLIDEIRTLGFLLDQYDEKAIWITEMGWNQTWLEHVASYRGSTADQIEADYLVRTYVPLLSEPGVEKVFWYTLLHDGNAGENFVLNEPGKHAVANLAKLLTDSRPLGQFQGQDDQAEPGDDDVYEYRFKNGKALVIIAWKARGGEEPRDVIIRDLDAETIFMYPIDTPDLLPETARELTVENGMVTLALTEHPVILICETKNLWQRLVDWWNEWKVAPGKMLEEWWQQLIENLESRLQEWLEEQQERIMKWLEQQILDWLSQICGTAMVPVGVVVASVWLHHKRKNHKLE